MTFDFFNASDLAFGGKLTSAFKQLFNKCKQAEDNIDSVLEKQSIYSDYLFKNYIVGEPTNASSPCRTNEILNIIKNKKGNISVVLSNNANGNSIVTVRANIYDFTNNIVTTIQDSFTITKEEWGVKVDTSVAGQKKLFVKRYFYAKLAKDNMSMIVNVDIRTDKKTELEEDEFLAFIIKVNPYGEYVIDNVNPRFNILGGDFSSYKGCHFVGNTSEDFKPFIKQSNDGSFEILNDIILSVAIQNADRLIINGVKRYDLTHYVPLSFDPDYRDVSWVYIPFKKGDTGRFEYWISVKHGTGWYPVKLIDRSRIVDYTEY